MIRNQQILCHRGFWLEQSEQNSIVSFTRAFKQGFGIETDIRDHGSKLVISHDPPAGSGMLEFSTLLEMFTQTASTEAFLGINIKADGLASQIRGDLRHHGIGNYFVFDMSIPELVRCRESGLKYLTRLSEYETIPIEYDGSAGIWLDAFNHNWYSDQDLSSLVEQGIVCIVSSELHGRDPSEQWSMCSKIVQDNEKLLICTDRPLKALEFFK